MAPRTTTNASQNSVPAKRKPPKGNAVAAKPRDRWPLILTALVVLAIGGLYWIYQSTNQASTSDTTPRADYQVGSPGPGEKAPEFTLPSTTGDTVGLADYQGKNVLLYFHEGLGCQPCWDQIRDLEQTTADLKAAGVDELVAITTGPADLITRKVTDDGLSAVNLADRDLAVSVRYATNKYGMMGETRNGHSFILVGPDGTIRWRADYGGAPKYTMYVPVPRLLADLKAGVEG